MYNPKIIKIDQLTIEEIIFDDSYDVTIFCDALLHQEQSFITLGLGFEDLNFILMQSGKHGLQVAEAIGEQLSRLKDVPGVIDVDEVLGHPLEVDTCILEVYKPQEMDEYDRWIENEDGIYFLDNVIPKSQQELEATNNRKKFQEHLDLLRIAFQYYNKLRETGMNETDARKKAGLADELLFKIAFYYSKMKH